MLCPNCNQGELRVVYETLGVPTNSVLLLDTAEEAKAFPTGDIRLGVCDHCGFVSNTSFDPALTEYSGRYEPTQSFSGTFNAFHENLADELIERYDLRDRDVVEIGCGNGEFLVLLCARGDNRGIGYDPSHDPARGPQPVPDGISFVSDFYSEAYRDHGGDFVACKMTLEHIHRPDAFVATVRRAVLDHATVFFQVPNADYVFGDVAFWDVYYEHCSYFSLGSLATVFRRNRFDLVDLETTYAEQYLTVVASPTDAPTEASLAAENNLDKTIARVDDFAEAARASVAEWRARFGAWKAAGETVVLWGGGSKAVAFVTTLGLDDEIAGAVDINPRKWGYHLAGSGHRVLSPDDLPDLDPDVIVVMNPVYTDEIAAQCRSIGIDAEIISL
ncbi:MAG: class I SAM-dependent methyltransferase [Actinomycetota bacterium]